MASTRNLLTHHIPPPDWLPEGEGESRGVAVLARRGGLDQAEAEDGGDRDEEEGQGGGEEEGKLIQDFACFNIIMTDLISFFLCGNGNDKVRTNDHYLLGAPIPFLILDPESRMSIMTDLTWYQSRLTDFT